MRSALPLALALTLAGAAPARQAADDAGALERGLDRVGRLVDVQRWDRARGELDRLLEEHAGSSHALARAREIELVAMRIAFFAGTARPGPSDFFRGEVVAWNDAAGRIALRYGPESAADLEETRGARLHPVSFERELRLVATAARPPVVVLGVDGDAWTVVGARGPEPAPADGPPRWTVYAQRHAGGEVVASAVERVADRGGEGPRELRVETRAGSVCVSFGGAPVLEIEAPARGRAGLAELPAGPWCLELAGVVDRSWLIARADASLQSDWERFRAAWDPARHLPPWLADALAPRREERDPARRLEVAVPIALGSFSAALRDPERAVALFSAAIEESPADAILWRTTVLLHMRLGRLETAREWIVRARASGIPSRELADLEAAVAGGLGGPAWPERHEFRSGGYLVVSDQDPYVARRVARELESAARHYRSTLGGAAERRSDPLRVWVFSGRAGFDAYARDVLGSRHENAVGLYSPWMKQLLVWNPGDEERLLETVRHEGLHQFLDHRVADAPVWLNEGLAEFFEVSRTEDGRWRNGAVQAGHVRLLAGEGPLVLERLLDASAEAFRAEPERAYASAWLLVHFLLTTGRANRLLFDELLLALEHEAVPAAAFDRALEGRGLDALRADLGAHLASLVAAAAGGVTRSATPGGG